MTAAKRNVTVFLRRVRMLFTGHIYSNLSVFNNNFAQIKFKKCLPFMLHVHKRPCLLTARGISLSAVHVLPLIYFFKRVGA